MVQVRQRPRTVASMDVEDTLHASRSGRRRQELVDVAANIFAEKGYHATSVQDIAESLGILKGSIYYYIDSKEDLLYEIVDSRLKNMESVLRRLRSSRLDPLAKLRGFICDIVAHVHADPVKSAVVLRDLSALTGERLERATAALERQDRFLRRQVSAGQKAGLICPDAEPALTSRGILGMVTWTYRGLGQQARFGAERTGEAFADIVLAGLRCDRKEHTQGHRRALGALPVSW
ncbi:MAG: TetR family transcriptional regulator [Streptosporangiales bacterium]|nr:TetR family transcriptional regulator [Streptosporangiales bacterium]